MDSEFPARGRSFRQTKETETVTEKQMKNNVFRKKNMLPHNSLVAQMVKNLFSMWMTEVRSLGRGRSLGEENGNPFQCSCWETPWTEEPGWLQSTGPRKSQTGPSD